MYLKVQKVPKGQRGQRGPRGTLRSKRYLKVQDVLRGPMYPKGTFNLFNTLLTLDNPRFFLAVAKTRPK